MYLFWEKIRRDEGMQATSECGVVRAVDAIAMALFKVCTGSELKRGKKKGEKKERRGVLTLWHQSCRGPFQQHNGHGQSEPQVVQRHSSSNLQVF